MAAPTAIVLLCDENTASDGELLVHRFQKCGLVSVQALIILEDDGLSFKLHLSIFSLLLCVSSKGVVIGARTWGGVMVAGESEPLSHAPQAKGAPFR